MRVFYCVSFDGHYPVGSAAVIVAKDRRQAKKLLLKQLQSIGLGKDHPSEWTLVEIWLDEPRAYVLNDGDY